MQQLDLTPVFNRELAVPNVNKLEELAAVLREMQSFQHPGDITSCLNELREITGSDQVGVGIKNVLLAAEDAKDDANPPARLAELLAGLVAASQG